MLKRLHLQNFTVFADANLESALQAAFWGIFWNKGEVCVAGSRILVEDAIYDEFVERLAQMAKDAVLGDPLDPKTQIGPIASRAEYDKVLRYIESGKESSAKLVAGGGTRIARGRRRQRPHLLTRRKQAARK